MENREKLRTLQEYKEDVFDQLTEEDKLKWMYDMSLQIYGLQKKVALVNRQNEDIYESYCETLKYKGVVKDLKEWCKSFTTNEFNYNFLVVTIKEVLSQIERFEEERFNKNGK